MLSFPVDTEAINLEVTGNSHNATSNTISNKVMEDGNADQTDANNKEKVAPASSRKEKSVLQGKLTRLAIQIGYGGKNENWSVYIYCKYCKVGTLYLAKSLFLCSCFLEYLMEWQTV